jgi:hypothetical protein
MEEKQVLLVVILVLNQVVHGETLRRNGAVGKCFVVAILSNMLIVDKLTCYRPNIFILSTF